MYTSVKYRKMAESILDGKDLHFLNEEGDVVYGRIFADAGAGRKFYDEKCLEYCQKAFDMAKEDADNTEMYRAVGLMARIYRKIGVPDDKVNEDIRNFENLNPPTTRETKAIRGDFAFLRGEKELAIRLGSSEALKEDGLYRDPNLDDAFRELIRTWEKERTPDAVIEKHPQKAKLYAVYALDNERNPEVEEYFVKAMKAGYEPERCPERLNENVRIRLFECACKHGTDPEKAKDIFFGELWEKYLESEREKLPSYICYVGRTAALERLTFWLKNRNKEKILQTLEEIKTNGELADISSRGWYDILCNSELKKDGLKLYLQVYQKVQLEQQESWEILCKDPDMEPWLIRLFNDDCNRGIPADEAQKRYFGSLWDRLGENKESSASWKSYIEKLPPKDRWRYDYESENLDRIFKTLEELISNGRKTVNTDEWVQIFEWTGTNETRLHELLGYYCQTFLYMSNERKELKALQDMIEYNRKRDYDNLWGVLEKFNGKSPWGQYLSKQSENWKDKVRSELLTYYDRTCRKFLYENFSSSVERTLNQKQGEHQRIWTTIRDGVCYRCDADVRHVKNCESKIPIPPENCPFGRYLWFISAKAKQDKYEKYLKDYLEDEARKLESKAATDIGFIFWKFLDANEKRKEELDANDKFWSWIFLWLCAQKKLGKRSVRRDMEKVLSTEVGGKTIDKLIEELIFEKIWLLNLYKHQITNLKKEIYRKYGDLY